MSGEIIWRTVWTHTLYNMVRARGVEPPPLAGPDPKSGVSAVPPRAPRFGWERCHDRVEAQAWNVRPRPASLDLGRAPNRPRLFARPAPLRIARRRPGRVRGISVDHSPLAEGRTATSNLFSTSRHGGVPLRRPARGLALP